MLRGKDSMMKQELIDATEATGLSESAIGYIFSDLVYYTIAPHVLSASLTMSGCIMSSPNNTRAKPGNSQNDWYTGWNSMKTLISKALVVKWSNPAK
jgi:crossover junction endonuclease MUS81